MGLPFVISRDVDLGLLQRCVCTFAIGATYVALEDDITEVLGTAVECEKGDVRLVRCWTVYGPRGIMRVVCPLGRFCSELAACLVTRPTSLGFLEGAR